MKKKVLFTAAFMLATVSAFAQGNGIAGITEATNMVTSYFDPGTKLIYAVGAVVGLIGGVNQWICIALGVISASVLVWATFHLNAKYGEWGLMKMQAVRNHPSYIINRKRFLRLIIPNLKNRKS